MSNKAETRIYVDFNSRDQDNNVILNLASVEKRHLAAILTNGMVVELYDETLEIRASVKWNEEIGRWVATPNEETIRHLDYPPKT